MDDIPPDQRYHPSAIAYRADHTPERVFAVLPKGDALEDGFYDLTYRAFDKAIDKTAYWLDAQLHNVEQTNGHTNGDTRKTDETVCYVGPNDFRYVLFQAATLKTGHTLMVPMPANTAESRVKLLKAQGCRIVLAGGSFASDWSAVASQLSGGRLIQVPEIPYFLEGTNQARYPNKRSDEEAREKPLLVIQSSGTTGDPKPIIVPYRYVESFHLEAQTNKSAPPDQRPAYAALTQNCYMPNLTPMSWGYSMTSTSIWPLTKGNIPILPPHTAPQPMTTDYVFNLMKHMPRGKKNAIIFVPSVLQDLARDPTKLESLRHYDWIGYVGAPLDPAIGDQICRLTRLQSVMGSTEAGSYPLLLNPIPENWNEHRLHPSLHGFFLSPFASEENLYEICIRRQPDECRHCFLQNPGIEIFHTKDLVRLVPGKEKEEFWTPAGRVDDFVKLASMTKFNGVKIEALVSRGKEVRGCIVAGDGRHRPFAIVEPAGCGEGVMEKVWDAIEVANESLLEEARIRRNMVILTDAGRPMRRLAKGTVDRRKMLKEYEVEIERLYKS